MIGDDLDDDEDERLLDDDDDDDDNQRDESFGVKVKVNSQQGPDDAYELS